MEENLLHEVLASSPSKFALITENAERFRFQALLSYVIVDSSGRPTLTRHGYRVDHEYFYPASAIKLCGAVAALYKLEHLQKSLGLSVTLTTPLAFYPLQEGEPLAEHDPSNVVDGTITLAHEIRKLCLVSDNLAFNRLYAFSGQRYINERMWQLGLQTTRVQHRLSMQMSTEENKYCEPVEMRVPGMSATLPPKKNAGWIHSISELKGLKIGAGHVLKNGEVVMQSMDFSKKNYISLLDLQNLLVKILCQDVELVGEPCKLFHGSQMLLREAMADYPSESCNPVYLKSEFPDDYSKLFLPGVCRVRPKKALRIFNKVGRAYGFTIENSYIFDKERGQGFFLSAVIYTNNNGILNDDKYEYEDVADRVMADLGEMVARAVWKLPPTHLKVSPCFDCTPSSLWKELQRPSHRANASDEVEVSQVEIRMGAVDLHTHTFDNHRPKPMIGAFQLSSSVLPISSDSGPSILSELEGDASLVKCEPSVTIACCFKYFLNG